MDEVRRLIATSRLVTLFGAGGLGKTRLSLQVAAEVLDDFPDGVWFVELAPLRGCRARPAGGRVGARPARRGRATGRWWRRSSSFLKDRKVLLMLDNCEHLVQRLRAAREGAAAGGYGVRILATSRETIAARGRDDVYQVSPLAVPQRGQSARRGCDRAVRGGAALRRARERGAAGVSRVDGRERPPVGAICRGSTAFRSRSSSRRRASGRCPSRRSPRASTTASAC